MIEERRNPSPAWTIAAVTLAFLLSFTPLPVGAQTGTIFGVVTAPDGVTPVEGASIELRSAGSANTVAWDTTLIDGTFALASATLLPGKYTLIAHQPDQSDMWESEPQAFEFSDKTKDLDLGTIRLTYPQVRGTVLEPDGVTTYPQGDIHLFNEDETVSNWDSSSAEKNFTFSDLKPGKYDVEVVLPEDSPFWAPEKITVDVLDEKPTKIQQVRAVTFTLSYVQVEGEVVEPDGKTRAASDSVNLVSADGSLSLWDSTTITQTFRFGGLEPGDYLLQMFLPEGSPLSAPDQIPVSIKEKAITKKPDVQHFTLRLAHPQVQGAVFGPDGKTRVDNWNVLLTAQDGKVVATNSGAITQTFRLGGLPPGTYYLQAEPPPSSPYWNSKPVPITIAPGSQSADVGPQTADLTLTYPQIEGFVTTPDGKKRVSGVEVNLRTADETTSEWDSGAADKAFRFGGLKPGAYLLEAQATGSSPFIASPIVPITITNASPYLPTVTQRVDLALTYPQIEGVVLEPDGKTRYGAGDVKLWNAAETMAVWAPVSSGTTFRFGRLQPGPYGLKIVLPPGSRFWAPSPTPVEVRPDSMYQPPQMITITLENANVTGRITYKGKPVGDAGVGVYDPSGRISNWATTDKDGNFSIGGLKPDRYTLGVETAQAKTAERWLGPVNTIIFNLPDTKTVVDVGVIQVEEWLPFLQSNLRRPR